MVRFQFIRFSDFACMFMNILNTWMFSKHFATFLQKTTPRPLHTNIETLIFFSNGEDFELFSETLEALLSTINLGETLFEADHSPELEAVGYNAAVERSNFEVLFELVQCLD